MIIANLVWALASLKDALLFKLSSNHVRKKQEEILRGILRANQRTEYGHRYSFSEIGSYDDFKRAVPVSSYDDYETYIQGILSGKKNVLTREPVRVLEPTSGSASGTKYIPYTDSLQKEFSRAIAPWVVDLFLAHPRMVLGSGYWSITPAGEKKHPNCSGVKVGFNDDSEYFGKIEKWMIEALMVVPKEVSGITQMENFWYATSLFLLKDPHPSFISVWNPTFFLLLIKHVSFFWRDLLGDIELGTISFPLSGDRSAKESLQRNIRPDPERAHDLKRCRSGSDDPKWIEIWPHLTVISCWGSERSLPYLEKLKQAFPQAKIQPKGLIATEGFVTFPLENVGFALSVRSHFFEFEELEEKEIKLAHELEEGKEYSVIITTGGGLYRYRLGDIVKVSGWYNQCPLLEFRGRGQYISDLFGEKLEERFVETVLKEELERLNIELSFSLVAPESDYSEAIAYTLFLESSASESESLRVLGSNLEKRLCENFHYSHCRKLGQLLPLRIFLIDDSVSEAYLNGCVSLGQKLGNIKPQLLRKELGWSKRFMGKHKT